MIVGFLPTHRIENLAGAEAPAPFSSHPEAMMKHLDKLTARCCRWVVGPASDLMYCGKMSVRGTSWCREHFERVFVPGTKPPAQSKKVKHPVMLPVDMIPAKAPADLGIVSVPELEEVMPETE